MFCHPRLACPPLEESVIQKNRGLDSRPVSTGCQAEADVDFAKANRRWNDKERLPQAATAASQWLYTY